MYHFFVRIFGSGDAPTSAAPLSVTFDDALDRLAALPGLFIEPDGSFVWRSNSGQGPAWQLDGNLFDRGDTLFYVELKGSCPRDSFDILLACLQRDNHPCAFEWVERGLLMSEPVFRRTAESADFTESPRGD